MNRAMRKAVGLLLAVLMTVGMMSSIVLPASAATVFIIDPNGTDGASGSFGGVSGTVYTSYAAFETAYTGTATADVYFTAGEFGAITVSKSVNLFGAKHGVDPNAHGADLISEWSLASGRGTGETVFTGQVRVTTAGTNGVTVDGVTLDGGATFKIESYASDMSVVLRNIVVGDGFTGSTYFLNASPTVNTVPAAGNYPMRFTLQNVYAGNYAGTGKWFLYFIAARQVTLDNIYFSNTDTMFIETSAASRNGNEFVMKNCFLYNNMTSWSGTQATVYHRFPSTNMTESVSFENNVFYNAHGYNQGASSNNVTIMLPEIKNLTQYYNFYGNVFVSTEGCKAAVRNVSANTITSGSFDAANVTVKENAFVGYLNSLNSYDGNNKPTIGKIDMSDNFSYNISTIGTGISITTEAQLNALTGVAPRVTQRGLLCDTTGPYYLNFARTVSTDMCRITGIDLADASIDGTTVTGVVTTASYVPTLTYTCGNDIPRTISLKDAENTPIGAITASGTYTMTVGYETQSRDFTLTVDVATPYTGDGYMFDPSATGETVAHYWDGAAHTFTVGENLFTTLSALKSKAVADGVAVPDVLIPAGRIEGKVEITFSCNILGAKHGIDPNVRVAAETRPWTLSAQRGTGESIFAGEVVSGIPASGLYLTIDGVALDGDGRFRDNVAGRYAEITYKNIYVFPGQMSSAAGTNARFINNAYSTKKLTYENIHIDGAAVNSANGTKQMFLTFGKQVVIKGLYYANTSLPLIPNVMLQSYTDLTADLSFTMEDSRFYNCNTQDGAFLASYYGDESHAYLRYDQRENVDYTFRNNVFFNCANATTGGNNYQNCAVINVRYPYPSFHYLFDGNTFIDTRPTASFIADNPGTDVYGTFLHLLFKNNKKNQVCYGISLRERIVLTRNRFIGEQTVMNVALPSSSTLPATDGNFVLSSTAVQAMADPVTDILTAQGENPYETVNTVGYRPDNYYVDYALTTLDTAFAPKIGTVTTKDRTVELVKTSGMLTPASFAPDGATVVLKENGTPVALLDTGALSAGTHIYTLDVTRSGSTVSYVLLLHTATTGNVYADASLLAPALDGVADGHTYYAAMNGTLFRFTTGETAYDNIDRIAHYTQTETPTVLLPAGTYTDEQLTPKVSVNYVYDDGAVCNRDLGVRAGKIKVACVGDSVTLGTGATNRALYAYPAVLQNTLGADYEVVNFGRGGSLASNSVGFPYRQTYNYNRSLQFDPDVVILEIGVNDMQSGYFGTALDYLREEYVEFIRSYQNLDSHPIVYLASVHNVQSGWPTEYLDGLYAIQQQAAADAGVTFIDERTLGARWDNASYFSDNCHPNNAGYVELVADYHGTIDWTETGAHLPTAQTVSFTQYTCTHVWADGYTIDVPPTATTPGSKSIHCTLCGAIKEGTSVEIPPEMPSLFDMSVRRTEIAAMASGNNYTLFAELGISATDALTADPDLDVKVLEYGMLYATNIDVLSDFITREKNDTDTTGLNVRKYLYDSSETGLTRLCGIYSYRFNNIKPNRARAVAAYIRYEAGGTIYREYSAVDAAASFVGGYISGVGPTLEENDLLDD